MTKLKPKHRMMAVLEAAVWDRPAIAKHLGCKLWSIHNAARSQAYRKAVDDEVIRLRDRVTQSVVDRVMADGEANVRFLQSVRDGLLVPPEKSNADVDVVNLRLRASQTLFDRQVPKRIESSLDANLHITVEAHERQYLDDVAGEAIDVTPDPPEAA